jgi:hypothetical protein
MVARSVRISATKEAAAIAVPKLFCIFRIVEHRHHLLTFPIRWSVNLQ